MLGLYRSLRSIQTHCYCYIVHIQALLIVANIAFNIDGGGNKTRYKNGCANVPSLRSGIVRVSTYCEASYNCEGCQKVQISIQFWLRCTRSVDIVNT